MATGLETYWKMRDFRRTPEPKGKVSRANRRRFVVQEHHASKLHFDFRLEMGGVLKSWSVPRGPSLDPADKRLAVQTEDHPVEYLKFEGQIPEGEYGAGRHMKWDDGTYRPTGEGSALEQLEAGRLTFELKGKKLSGEFSLIQMKGRGEGQWLLIKKQDEFAEPGWALELREPVDGKRVLEEKSKAKKQPAAGAAAKSSSARAGVRKVGTRAGASGEKVVPAARALKAKKLGGDRPVRVGRDVVHLTSLDRVYWPDEGITKGELIRYYYEISEHILPHLKGRPLIMKRYPLGVRGQFFHQHDVNEVPEFVRTVTLEVEEGGHTVDYIVGDNRATLLYMANLGAIERHPFHSRVADLDRPDWMVFDLDPGEGVEFETICRLAVAVREVLARLGLEGHPKTSGSRGLHVYVPFRAEYEYERVAEFAERVATVVAREHAEVATVERSLKKRRRGQIYVDHMQNAKGKSVVAPYSVRPREGATVSAPLEWGEVERRRITPRDFTIKNILRRIRSRGDLFKPVLAGRQKLDDAFEAARELLREKRARRARA
ncbi:MAG TPA: non-homologous end-joining DNA ligase [Pyrinomonadaceae bacterium]|nr:non-homologous end-joining DNA ligase [Pyrinomonadaceae bacterium]